MKNIALVHWSASALSTRRRIARPRTVVEGQHDFLVAQEVVGLEMLEAEARAAGGVDLHHARDAERVRDWSHFASVAAGAAAGAGAGVAAAAGAGAGAFASSAQAVVTAADIEIARAKANAVRITGLHCPSSYGRKCLA